MLKFLNYNKKNSFKDLELILNKRKSTQNNKASVVKKIIFDVKKNGDKAVIRYEKKFSKTTIKSSKIIFSKQEINKIAKKTDKKIKQSIDLAEHLNSNSISITSGLNNLDNSDLCLNFFHTSLIEIGEYAEKKNISIAIEYEPNLLIDNSDKVWNLISKDFKNISNI